MFHKKGAATGKLMGREGDFLSAHGGAGRGIQSCVLMLPEPVFSWLRQNRGPRLRKRQCREGGGGGGEHQGEGYGANLNTM